MTKPLNLQKKKKLEEPKDNFGKLVSKVNIGPRLQEDLAAKREATLEADPERKARLERSLEMQRQEAELKKTALQQNVKATLLGKEAAEQQITQPQTEIPTVEQLKQNAVENRDVAGNFAGLEIPKIEPNRPVFDRNNRLQSAAARIGADVRQSGNLFVMGIKKGFDVVDNFRTLLTGGDTLDVKQAKKTFTDTNTELGAQIEQVRQGADPTEAINAMQDMMNANVELQSLTKRKGLDNLRYWIRSGAEIEAETLNNERQLERLRLELEAAIKENKINQAALMYGLQ